jgi:hypothetical protein
MIGVQPEGGICEINSDISKMSKIRAAPSGHFTCLFCLSNSRAKPLKTCQKIILNNKHNLNKIRSIIISKNPEVLILESEKASSNVRTHSIAYKLVMDDSWIGIETKHIKRKRDTGLLKITLINHQINDKYRLRHRDAEVSKNHG